MSILRIPILFVGSKGEKKLNALWRMKLDFEHDRVIINARLGRLQLV